MIAANQPAHSVLAEAESREYLDDAILPDVCDILPNDDVVTVSALLRSLPPDAVSALRHRLINSARRELGKATRMAVTNAISDIFR